MMSAIAGALPPAGMLIVMFMNLNTEARVAALSLSTNGEERTRPSVSAWAAS